MERSEISSCCANGPGQASNYDELFMNHHLLFADSLKDLKNIRRQMYSAAEYFESSYDRDDNKQLVVETLRDYVTNALVSSVDHLGSVAYKVDSFLDDKVNEISETNFRFSCIEQRLRVCQEFIGQGGLRQQSLVIETPKYHKRYIIPAEPTLDANSKTEWNCNNPSLFLEYDFHQPTQATTVKPDTTLLIRERTSRPPSATPSSGPGNFSFTSAAASNKVLAKRGVSPLRFSLRRSESVANRSISPNPSNNRQRFPSAPQRSLSLSNHPETPKTPKELQQYSNRSKSIIKTLLRYTSPRRIRS